MADFCKKCADGLGFEADLTIVSLEVNPGHYVFALCEGCGTIAIVNNEGEEVVLRADKPIVLVPAEETGG